MKLRVRVEAVVIATVVSMVVIVLGSFVVNFWNEPIATATAKWGEFGDYVGGALNPLVALAALALLAVSIRIQRKELAETKEVLALQAKTSGETAKLAALSSLVDAAAKEADMHREHLHHYVQQVSEQDRNLRQVKNMREYHDRDADDVYVLHDLDGSVILREAAGRRINLIKERISQCLIYRDICRHEITKILAGQGVALPADFNLPKLG